MSNTFNISDYMMHPRKAYGVVYGEYGYEIIGGPPPVSAYPEIEAQSKIRMAEARAERRAAELAISTLHEDLWAINHPIRSRWNKLASWIRSTTW